MLFIMFLYIDPGTGGMLFSILIGILGAAAYSLKMLSMKLRFKISGGKAISNENKIPLVIFSDDKRYWTIFDPICRELDKMGMDVHYMTVSEDDPALNNTYEHVKAEFIGKNAKAFTRLNFLNATIVFSTTPGLDVYQWHRSKEVQYYVHIQHSCSDVTRYRMFGIDYYDAILLSGQYQIEQVCELEKIRNLPAKELVLVGVPYMDEMVTRLQNASPIPEHPRTVLLAPTWGKSSIFNTYGTQIIDILLLTGYHIIIRPHPQSFTSEKDMMDKLMQQYPDSEQLEWNKDADNFEVLRRSDILISDFSGVLFDFALVYDKPIIYTNPKFDAGQYDAWWLETPLWTFSALPKLGVELSADNLNNLKHIIDSCLTDSQYSVNRQSIKDETWVHFGEGAKRTATYLFNKYCELTKKKEDL